MGKTRAAGTCAQLADTAQYSSASESWSYSSRPSKDSHKPLSKGQSQQEARPNGPISSTPMLDPWIAGGPAMAVGHGAASCFAPLPLET